MSAGGRSVDSRGLPTDIKGSTQNLWNLLLGHVVLATEDVLAGELKESIDLIMGALTYYKPYEGGDDDKPVTFPSAPSLHRSFLTGKVENIFKKEEKKTADPTDGASTSQGAKRKPSQPEVSPFDKIRKAVAQNLNLDLEVATELMVSYIMFEFKGCHISYEEIADTQLSFKTFLGALKKFYMKERICLLLAIQAILVDMEDEHHEFFRIVESFQSASITYKKWCWGLLRSIAVAQNETEIIEILHCLTLIMFKMPKETLPEFFTYLTKIGFDDLRKSESMKMAEAAAMYSALIVSGITDCCSGMYPTEFGPIIIDFIMKNFYVLLQNPYNIAPVFAAYDIFCKEDADITNMMKRVKCNPSINFSAMLKLIEHYEKDSVRDRHTLSLVISASMFEALECLLVNYDVNHFGTSAQGNLVFAKILQHNRVAERFLCDRPIALTALYTDATTLFPGDIPSTLHIWKSLCMSVNTADLCGTIIKGIAKMNCIAEFVDYEASVQIKRLDLFRVCNLKTRTVYGVRIEENATGMLNQVGESTCIVWELSPSSNVSAFEVLRWSIQPVAEKLLQMKADNTALIEFEEFDYAADDLHAICDFVIQFWNSSNHKTSDLTSLVHPMCIIMEQMIKHKTDINERIRLIQDLFGLITAVNRLSNEPALINYIHDLLPSSDSVSLLSSLILGRESIKVTKCEVTLAFLDMVASFTSNERCWSQGVECNKSAFETQFTSAIGFMTENILTSCCNWRTENEGVRLEIYLKCLRIFDNIYSLGGEYFLDLKRTCIRPLVAPNSCFIRALRTEENDLQDSIIVPDEDNRLLPDVMTVALKLFLEMLHFDARVIRHVDHILDGMLVRLMGRLVRHRLLAKIPTLTMMVLGDIAEKTTLSLLACFGNDESAFRDIIIQRLEFTAEDVNLKVAVLEFFTIIAQTQIGIIECFFGDGVLENCITDLISAENEDLAVACLNFFRSLFRQKLPLPKSREDFWPNIFTPINLVKCGSRLEIVTATLHILTFDLFLNGRSDPRLNKELDTFFQTEQFASVIEAAVAETDEVAVKCLCALKHFLTLILGRPELTAFIPNEALIFAQGVVLERFCMEDPVGHPSLCATLAELTIVLTTPDSATPAFITNLLSSLGDISQHCLAAQLSVLCLINKSFSNCKEPVQRVNVESTFRIIRRMFDTSAQIMGTDRSPQVYPVLTLAASMITTITSSQHIDVWGAPIQKELIPDVLLFTASKGIFRKKSPGVVANCISALITLAEHPFGCTFISTSNVSRALNPNLYKFTDEACDDSWLHVFLLCLNLNSKLLMNLKNVYVDDAISFWTQYSGFLNHKLSIMADLTEICVGIDDAEKGYTDMKEVLLCTTFVLNDILTLMPYLEKWMSVQPSEVYKTIRFVFYILQEVCGLLQQPYLLQTSVGIKQKGGHAEPKLSPRVFEMQTKLWDISSICAQILVKLKSKEDQFIEKGLLMPTVFQLGQLTIKAVGKAERKAGSPGAGASGMSKYIGILEKVLVIIYNYVTPILDDPTVDQKYQQTLRRDLCTDVVSLCDGVRRLGCCKTDFLHKLCSKMDEKFK